MSRPRKEDFLRRGKKITLKLTEPEYNLISSAAANARMSRSEYIRRQLFQGKVITKYQIVADFSELSRITSEFSAIGNNLNQIARYFNMGGLRSKAVQEEIREALASLLEMKKEVMKLSGDYQNLTEPAEMPPDEEGGDEDSDTETLPREERGLR